MAIGGDSRSKSWNMNTEREVHVMFSDEEISYIESQRLARIATASSELQPDVAPVGFDFDGTYFYVGGLNLPKTLKYKNVQGNPRVSLVIDDLESINPWRPRGIKIHGIADLTTRKGYAGAGTYIRIEPREKWSWGIEEPAIREDKPVIKKSKVD
jgi:pyridoxamine 5'-phosphate oxidase family protein